MNSDASKIITYSFRELSKRAGERGTKAVVKLMYDRGSPKQVFNNHQYVPESEFVGGPVNLPPLKEMPNLELEVVNFHRPIFGTFHAKFMVVDRNIAIINSNNIQDNDNLEMMTHLEGPIVDSFYDLSILCWHNAFHPPLPQIKNPAAKEALPSFQHPSHNTIFDDNGLLKNFAGEPLPQVRVNDDQKADENAPGFAGMRPKDTKKSPEDGSLAKITEMVIRERLPEHNTNDPHYDPDIAAEVKRARSVLSPKEGESKMQAVTRHLSKRTVAFLICLIADYADTTLQKDTTGDAPECDPSDDMTPMIPLPAHNPVPMAMVNRKSWGGETSAPGVLPMLTESAPNHSCVRVPQNEAFLSAIRNAERSVFIQTPNLNAEPLIPAIINACKRGVDVTYYVCLGYNDAVNPD